MKKFKAVINQSRIKNYELRIKNYELRLNKHCKLFYQ
jgi:hypothetical protein